jgi:NADH-quinone oxidoreductase subunit K
MASVPASHGLLLAAVLFGLGLAGLLVRRNVLFVLMCIEIMLNAAGLAFVAGLALVLRMFHQLRTLDVDAASAMRG